MARLRIILALSLTYMLFGIMLNSVGIVILQSIATLGQTKASASILEAFKDLPIAITSFLMGSMLPRIGLRRGMIFGVCLVALACTLMPLWPAFTTAKMLFACVGIAFALVKVSVYASIGLITDDRAQHASLTTTIEGFFMIGVLSGYWIFSSFIDGRQQHSLAWLNAYWLMTGISVTVALLLATTSLDERAIQTQHRPAHEDFAAMIALVWRKLVMIFVVSAFIYVLIEQGINTWLPTFNREILKLSPKLSVQAASLFAASLAVGRLGAGFVLRYMAWQWLVRLCILAMAALVLISLPLTRHLSPLIIDDWRQAPIAALLLPLIGLFLAPIYPTINSVMLTALPKTAHAPMTGLLVVFSALGGTTGSLIAGQIFQRFNGQTAFYLELIPMGILLLSLNRFHRMSRGSTY